MLPTIKKEFIARIQEEIIKGSFLPIESDPSLMGLDEKKRSLTQENSIIHTADSDDEPLPLPIPQWIVRALKMCLSVVRRGDECECECECEC